MNSEDGYVYFIQTKEDLGTNIYKIGKTINWKDRMSSYRKGTIPYCIIRVKNITYIEDLLKIEFNKKFTLYRGREFFTGNLCEMQDSFLNLVITEDKKYRGLSFEELYIKLHRSCPYCWKEFNSGCLVIEHLQSSSCKEKQEGIDLDKCDRCGNDFSKKYKHLRHLQFGKCVGRNNHIEIPQHISDMQTKYKELKKTP